jgi:dsDNA-specific endonuclease/ATPase MutS2
MERKARGLAMTTESNESDPVQLPIEDVLDLHAFAPRDIPTAVEAYLEAAFDHGFGTVRIIHGRGIGFQRDRVRSILERSPLVTSFRDAPPEAGGWGATLAVLKTPHSSKP